jgi:small subunit ribosomal protein S1
MSEQQVLEAEQADVVATPAAETAVDVAEAAGVEASVEDSTPVSDPVSADPSDNGAAPSDDVDSEEILDASGRTVKLLSVGQQVLGTVKRLTEFGAFIDIGVGRDGLVHISEMSVRRVGKVADVLQEGQEVNLWIKKLDRDRNRISLTMIEPGKRTIRDLDKGDLVEGTVTRMMPYGAFIDIGVGRDALLHVREMGENFVAKPEDVVKIGETIEARIIDISRRRSRIDLSVKGLRPEPEPAAYTPSAGHHEATVEFTPEPEPEAADPFAEIEVLTPIQAALLRAQERSGVTLQVKPSRKAEKRANANQKRAAQEDIISRTLSSPPK